MDLLPKLFSSSVRTKILKFLVMHEGGSFTAAEIAEQTGSIVRSINKEMVKLVAAKAVKEEGREVAVNGKHVSVKHYCANRNFVVYDEVKQLFLKLQVFETQTFREQLASVGSLNYVALTGRFVGERSGRVDALVVGNAARAAVEKIMRDFEKEVGWEINWTLMPLEDYDYRKQVKDTFLAGILSGKKIEVLNRFV
jgi:hypothetical protein